MGQIMMTWFDWLGAWNESIEFGVAAVLALLGVECLVLAWKSYKRTRKVFEEGAFLGAEFGVYSAPSAQLRGPPDVPRNSYLLAAAGAASLTASMVLLTYSFV